MDPTAFVQPEMSHVVTRADDRIVVEGNVRHGDLRTLCVTLHRTIDLDGFREITLDFAQCLGVTEAVMLPLMPLIMSYRKRGVYFKFVSPSDYALSRLFVNTNWAHHIEPDEYSSSSHEGRHVPALCFGYDDSGITYDIQERVLALILSQLETDRDTLKAVEWSLCEIMDNVTNHAASPVGGFVQATAFKQTNRVEFVVADAGIGIPKSMRIDDHAEALRRAIDEGVTSDSTKNAGNGLYGSYRVASVSGGQFEINSLYGKLYCDANRGLSIDNERELNTKLHRNGALFILRGLALSLTPVFERRDCPRLLVDQPVVRVCPDGDFLPNV